MGLLTGAVSVTRFNVVNKPDEIDFEQASFQEIPPGSEVRESQGFVQCSGSFFDTPEARAAVISILRGERSTFANCGEIPGGSGFAFTPNINAIETKCLIACIKDLLLQINPAKSRRV